MPWLTVVAAGLSVAQSVGQANAQKQMAEIEAKQHRQRALADMAEAQLAARHERKRSDLLKSRAIAVAAASGTSVDSPNVVDTIADIDAYGRYNALAALYSGATSARSRNYAAALAKAQGKSAKQASYYQAGSTVLSSVNTNGWYGL